jgi:hypothetical protein
MTHGFARVVAFGGGAGLEFLAGLAACLRGGANINSVIR